MAMIVDKARRDDLAARRRSSVWPGRDNLPISAILPSLTPTSPRKDGIPEPSTIRPFLISRSYAMVIPFLCAGHDTATAKV